MRDRGISNPGTKVWIAGAIALGGAAAWIWGLQSPDPAAAPAKMVGAIALVIGVLMTANYLYTLSLIAKARRGEDVIGRWIVAPDDFATFRDLEHARKTRKNNWRVPRKHMAEGLEVIFTKRSVVVGNTWFRLAAKGMTHFSFARIEPESVPSVEFSMQLTITGAGTLAQTARYRGHLRIPIAKDAAAEAARVVAYFRGLV